MMGINTILSKPRVRYTAISLLAAALVAYMVGTQMREPPFFVPVAQFREENTAIGKFSFRNGQVIISGPYLRDKPITSSNQKTYLGGYVSVLPADLSRTLCKLHIGKSCHILHAPFFDNEVPGVMAFDTTKKRGSFVHDSEPYPCEFIQPPMWKHTSVFNADYTGNHDAFLPQRRVAILESTSDDWCGEDATTELAFYETSTERKGIAIRRVPVGQWVEIRGYSRSGRYFALARGPIGRDGGRMGFTVIDTSTGKSMFTNKYSTGFYRVVFSANEKWVAWFSVDTKTVTVFNLETKNIEASLSYGSNVYYVEAMAFHPEKKWLAVGLRVYLPWVDYFQDSEAARKKCPNPCDGSEIRMYDFGTGLLLGKIGPQWKDAIHQGSIVGLAFDGPGTLISAGPLRVVRWQFPEDR